MSVFTNSRQRTTVVVSRTGPQGPPGIAPAEVLGLCRFVAEVETDGTLQVTLLSPFGIDSLGIPYYDPAGASPGEEAWASLDPLDGSFSLTAMIGNAP